VQTLRPGTKTQTLSGKNQEKGRRTQNSSRGQNASAHPKQVKRLGSNCCRSKKISATKGGLHREHQQNPGSARGDCYKVLSRRRKTQALGPTAVYGRRPESAKLRSDEDKPPRKAPIATPAEKQNYRCLGRTENFQTTKEKKIAYRSRQEARAWGKN